MDTKTKNIIAAIVLLMAFFMPWVNVFGFFKGSAFDLVMQFFDKIEYVKKEPSTLLILLLLIFPISSLIILVNYTKNKAQIHQLKTIQFAKKSPLILIIITIIYGGIKLSRYLTSNDISKLFDVLSIGLLLTLISSVVLFFDKTTPISTSKSNTSANEVKEEINTDNLFK